MLWIDPMIWVGRCSPRRLHAGDAGNINAVEIFQDLNEIHRTELAGHPSLEPSWGCRIRTSMRRLLMSTTLALPPLALWPLKLIYRQPGSKP